MKRLMNKRGDAGDNPLWSNLVYLILFIIFLVPMFGFAESQRDGAATWEDFYAKEIARIVDISEPGTEIWLDVTIAQKIAEGRDRNLRDTFTFSNVNNEVIVSLRPNGATAYPFFNDVDIVGKEVVPIFEGKEAINRLHFKIVEAQK